MSILTSLEEILLHAMGEEETKKLIVHLLKQYAESTDNSVDDDLVRGVAAALGVPDA